MLQKLSAYLLSITNWKALVAALVVYLVFGAYIMPQGAKMFEQICGKKVEILDLQLSYGPDKAKAIIADYNDAGRVFAIKFGLIADTVYPVAYTFFFLSITSLISKGLTNYKISTGYMHLFPLLILPIDYLENISIVNLINSYPNLNDGSIYLASAFTSLKWLLVIVSAVITLGGLVILAAKQIGKTN